MVQNDFSKLAFVKSAMEFKDKRVELEGKIKGDFTRDGMQENLQKIADSLKNQKGAMVGVAFHYKTSNMWVPAIYTNASDHVKLWNPLDSPDSNINEDESIDGAVYYIIKTDAGKVPDKALYRKPGKQTEKKDYADINVFLKNKKK